jgi:two-component system, NtrC family, sensor histidine kinase HydH
VPYTSAITINLFPALTIRKTLLVAFLLVSLLPSILLTSLAFFTAGSAMRKEISHSLLVQSATVSQDIDKMLFERLQNALTWRQLEVMQEIQVNDVDKRLTHFLSEVKAGYHDVYHELTCIDPTGRVVASSDPAMIGRTLPKMEDTLQPAGEQVALESLQLAGAENQATLTIRAGIPSQFKDGQAGELLLRFDWAQIYHILDQAAQGGRMVLLVDRQNRVIAASGALRGQSILLTELPHNWLPTRKHSGVATLNGTPLHLSRVTVGYEHSRGFQHFSGFGWTTLVVQPSTQAFIPIQHMALVFLALLAGTSAFAVGLSLLVTGRIAHPITTLTAFTRRFMREKTLPPVPADASGEVGELTSAFVQTVRDLDQSRADLVRASKLAVLGELAAVMAHEIRTPIGILRSSAQMLAREPGLSPEAQELTGFIESETERLNRLVTTLLDSARPRAPKLQPDDLNAIIRHSVDLLAAQADKKSIKIKLALDARHSQIEVDAEQMTQVLLNLVLNALQILPDHGQVEISTHEHAGKLVVEIADDGPGIPADELARVFDPFFTKREGGVGLGLAVVQQIIAAHGGEISAAKSPLGGALFTITLPIKDNP